MVMILEENLLQVLRCSIKFGDCSFSVAGPTTASNSPSDHAETFSGRVVKKCGQTMSVLCLGVGDEYGKGSITISHK